MALIICCAFLGIGMSKLRAQTLAAGDIAFIGYDFGTVDGFSFIALKTLPAGETIYFSEQGWTASGWANNTETHLRWVIPSTVPAGTIISIIETSADVFTVTGTSGVTIALNSGFNLLGGDQILAYQSTSGVAPANPIFIAGVHGDYNSTNYDATTTWNAANTAGTAESIVPLGLTNGTNCVSLFPFPGPEVANSKYTGTLTGSASALRAAINNPNNWSNSARASLGITPAGYAAPNVTADVSNPTVTTTAASNVTSVKATLGGNVTADGGGTVNERGIVWALGQDPTTSDNKVTIGGGTGVFSAVVSLLPAGTTINFRAYAINSNGTAYGANLSFTTTAALAATTSFTTVSCNGGGNGTATVVASGGKTPYTYAWSPSGGTNATATGLSVGVYTCTITDGDGTAITRNFTITQPTAMSAVTSKTNVSCNGGGNGTATIVPSGGVGPYSYSWAPSGGTAATATGLSVGNYTVTVTDANSCTITRGYTITQPTAMAITTSRTDLTCNGGSNGIASVNVTGGVPPYTYAWSPSGGSASMATGLAAGTYSVTITDANSCQATRNFTISQPTALTVTTSSQTNVACNGGTNGSATVAVTGGVPGYTYLWSPSGGTAATASGLAAGTYTCTVTDANACTKTQTVTIVAPSAITATTSSTSVSCNGGANGTATVVASGGTGALTYSWAPSGGTAATATGLAVGVYTVTITDANACSITRSVTITQPSAITSSTAQTNIFCNGGATGVATVNPTGGTPPYTYSWAPSGGTAASATGLTAGTYTVTITDANACTQTRTFNIQQSTAITATTSQTNVACNGGSNGVASVVAAGGNPPYSYSWAPSGGTAATATGLAVGTYTVTITDDLGCSTTRSVTLTQPTAITATTSSTNVSCNGGTNGTASVVASGGTGTLTYSWAPSGGTAASATGLGVGTYTCTITDANACSITRSVTITQPIALTASGSATAVSCNGGTNGTATIVPAGGTGPYTYSWAPSGGTAATATGLGVGVYTCTVTDANACFTSRSFTITQPVAMAVTTSRTDVSCNGASNGIASVNVTGGTAPYTYSWAPSGGTASMATGLTAGTYTCTITDSKGCTATRNFTISQPTALTVTTSSQTNVACAGGTNGSATVAVSGGVPGYTYSWAPSGGTAATATGLAAGTYTVTVTDANACTKTQTVTITAPTAITATTSFTTVSCNGGSNGTASVVASGGTGPLTYSWSPTGGTGATATGLGVGVYTCTITDANACSITRSVTITQPTSITAGISQTNVACNGGSTGIATVTPTGGTGPYSYSWAPSGGTAASATGLTAGTYTCTITDANACSITRSVTITQQPAITATTSFTTVSCNGGSNGTASVAASGGTGPLTYSWAPTGGTAATATGLSVGVYTVTITDAIACSITRSVTITQPTAITATTSQTNVACNGGSNGTASVVASGGTGPLTYSWAPSGGTAATANGLVAGTYTCTITDANACSITRSVTITQPTALQLAYAGAAIINKGAVFSYTFAATGGTPSYSYSSSGAVPAGLTLSVAGVLGGTPTTAGDYSFTVLATDANGCATTASVSIKVEDPLPVELVNFTAKAVQSGVEVTWITTSESNSSHFELLHATDKGEFKSLTKVDALGDSKTGKRYAFLHKNAVNGQNYYQLLQFDKNGVMKDYGVKQVNFSQVKDEVLLFPNPASHAITVKFPANVYQNLQVVDMLGKAVINSKITAKDQEHKLDIAMLPVGVYTVVLSSGNSKTVHKFIKQ